MLGVRESMGRPIAAIVVLNNIANIVGSIATGAIAARVLGSQWVGVFSAVLTLLVILGAEILPKTLGERHAEGVGLAMARPVLAVTWFLTPLLWLIERMTSGLVRQQTAPITDEGEIKLLARIGAEEGVFEETESRIVERAFHLHDQIAADVMTPRVAITSLGGEHTLEASKGAIVDSEHSRIVVLGDSVDDVVGIALKGDLLAALVHGDGGSAVADHVRPATFVHAKMRCDALLRKFLSAKTHLAVVVDEFGGVAGVVTLEDVLETITGEIMDETDTVADLRQAAKSAISSHPPPVPDAPGVSLPGLPPLSGDDET